MISIIVAFDEAKTIGFKGGLPWHFKEDLAYFKNVTAHHKCVMGRVTFESILKTLKKPLPNRENIVVSRQKLTYQGIEVINDLEQYLKANQDKEEEIFVIGGRLIYQIALPYAKKLYITHIKGRFEGDTYFPEYNESDYKRVYFDDHPSLSFAVYERMI
ncbi:dihydrofolate reductase [Liberiplasma polymorphum]|uniref:dihydrofolate reductase n=1 Tax=Liberiplasma polymorphum TaxID=3374570 RepID=UPI0037721471